MFFQQQIHEPFFVQWRNYITADDDDAADADAADAFAGRFELIDFVSLFFKHKKSKRLEIKNNWCWLFRSRRLNESFNSPLGIKKTFPGPPTLGKKGFRQINDPRKTIPAASAAGRIPRQFFSYIKQQQTPAGTNKLVRRQPTPGYRRKFNIKRNPLYSI